MGHWLSRYTKVLGLGVFEGLTFTIKGLGVLGPGECREGSSGIVGGNSRMENLYVGSHEHTSCGFLQQHAL